MQNNLDIIELGNPSNTRDYIVIQKYQRSLEIRHGSLVGTLSLDQAETLLRGLEVAINQLHDELEAA